MTNNTGIYTITNTVTGDIYVGSASRGIRARVNHHKYQLRRNKHHSIFLQRSWNKYGEGCFVFEVLEECCAELCVDIEQYWINLISPSFNMTKRAGSNYGYKHTKATKRNMSKASKGRPAWNKGIKIGNNYKENSFVKRKKTLEKNGTIAGKKPIELVVREKGSGKIYHFGSLSEASSVLKVHTSQLSLWSSGKVTSRKYEITRVVGDINV